MKLNTKNLSLWLSNNYFEKYRLSESSQPQTALDIHKSDRQKLDFEKTTKEIKEFFAKAINSKLNPDFRMALRELKATRLEEILFDNSTDELKGEYDFPSDDKIQKKLDSLLKDSPLLLPKGSHFQAFKEIFKITKLFRDFMEDRRFIDDYFSYENAFKILILFGNFTKFDSFLKEHNLLNTPNPLTKALEFAIPSEKQYGVKGLSIFEQLDPWAWAELPPAKEIHLETWRKLIAQSGPKGFPYFALAIQTEQVLNGRAPKSLKEAFDVMKPYQYIYWERDPELADIFLELRISESNFIEVMELKTQTKTYSNIPDLIIKGKEVNKKYKDYYLVKLPVNDPRFYILGHLTACCQSIDSDAGQFVKAAAQDPNIDPYVLLKHNKKKNKDSKDPDPQVFKNKQIDFKNFKIMGQGMVWLSKEGNLTIDSWENLNPAAEDDIIVDMLEAFGKEICAQGKGLRLTIGTGGKTPKALKDRQWTNSETSLSGVQYKDSLSQVEIYRDEKANAKNLEKMQAALINYLGEDFVTQNPKVVNQFAYKTNTSDIIECKIPGIKQFFHNIIKKNDVTQVGCLSSNLRIYFKIFYSLEKYLSNSIWQYLELCDPYQMRYCLDSLASLLNEIQSHGESVLKSISNKFIAQIILDRSFSTGELVYKKYTTFINLKLHEEKSAERLADFILEKNTSQWMENTNHIAAALQKLHESKSSEHSDLRLEILKFPNYCAEIIEVFQQLDQSKVESFNHYCDFLFRNTGSSAKADQIKLLKKWLDSGLHRHAALLNSEYFLRKKSFAELSEVIDRCEIISKLDLSIDSNVLNLLGNLYKTDFDERVQRIKSYKSESRNYSPELVNLLLNKTQLNDSFYVILNSGLPNIEMVLPIILNMPRFSGELATSLIAIHKIGSTQYDEFMKYVEDFKGNYKYGVGTLLSKLHDDKLLIQGDDNIFSFVLNLPLEKISHLLKNYHHVRSMTEFLNSPNIKAITTSPKERLKMQEFLLSNFGDLKNIQEIFNKEPITNPNGFIEFLFSKGQPPVTEIGNMIKRYNQLQTLNLSNKSARQNFLATDSKTLDAIFSLLKPYQLEFNNMVLEQILRRMPQEAPKVCQQAIQSYCHITIKLFRKLYDYIANCSNNLSNENIKTLNTLIGEHKSSDLYAEMDSLIAKSDSGIKVWQLAKKHSSVAETELFNNLLIKSFELLVQCDWPADRCVRVLAEILEQGLNKTEFKSDEKLSQFCTTKVNDSCTQTILKFRRVFQALHSSSKAPARGFQTISPL